MEREIEELLAAGKKIEAVKRYREATGASLAESKQAVESLQAGNTLPDLVSPNDSDLTNQVIKLLGSGERIKAVKLYKSQAGVRLKVAKQAVDQIATRNGIPVTTGSGCAGVVLIVIAVFVFLRASIV